jgi:hypothetical protein
MQLHPFGPTDAVAFLDRVQDRSLVAAATKDYEKFKEYYNSIKKNDIY